MDANLYDLIRAIHDARPMVALALTGGGSGAAAQLLAVPGASRTVLEVVVPYHAEALGEYLGYRPEQFCSANTAVAMAERALDRARSLLQADPDRVGIGLGCTASLVTDRAKQGDHRFYVAVASELETTVTWAVLQKGVRNRKEEEAVVDAVTLNELARVMDVSQRITVDLRPGEQLQTETRASKSLLAALCQGREPCIGIDADGQVRKADTKPRLLLPGAFNPLHDGHRQLARAAARLTALEPAFEISILNVDKPSLSIEEVRRRAQQFQWFAPLWLTRAATFVEKATLFPGVTFVVGFDTAARIVAPRYYDNDPARMSAALEQISNQGCRFLVAGRGDGAGRFLQLADLVLPATYRDLFAAIPEAEFHYDVSSTQLREGSSDP